jgi:hypothetical protein
MEVGTVKKLLIEARPISGSLSVVFLFVATVSLVAQMPAPPVDRTNQSRQKQQEMSKREYQLRNFGVERNVADEKQKKALMAQVEEDFSRILILHNQIARVLSSDAVLDYWFVSEAAAEIKKRSNRLQTTLALQPEEHKESSEESRELKTDLRQELLMLCKQIKSFVTNPVIETPGTVSAEQLAKARSDLAGIVALSNDIRKHAGQLSKHRSK